MSDKRVVQFKKNGTGGQEAVVAEMEENFGEFVDVVQKLRSVLDYYDPNDVHRSHEGMCTADTPCDEQCETVAQMQMANSLLNRLDKVMVKLNLASAS